MSVTSRPLSMVSVLLLVPALLFAQETYPIKVWPKVTGGTAADSLLQSMITEQLSAAEIPIAPPGVYPEDISVLEIHTSVMDVGEGVYDVAAVVTGARRGVYGRTAPRQWFQFHGVPDLEPVARVLVETMIQRRQDALDRAERMRGQGEPAEVRVRETREPAPVAAGLSESHAQALRDTIMALAYAEAHVSEWGRDLTRFTVEIAHRDVAVVHGPWQAEDFGIVEGGMVFVRLDGGWVRGPQWSSPQVKILRAPEDVPVEEIGVLRLWVHPIAYVSIDGNRIAYANRTLANLKAGSHTVRLSKDGYVTVDTVVSVIPRDTVAMMRALERGR